MPIRLMKMSACRAAVRMLMVTDIAPSLTAPAPTMVAARKGKNMVHPFMNMVQKSESPAHPKTGRAFRKGTTLSDYRAHSVVEGSCW